MSGDIPADEVMKMMAKVALEQATASLASKARQFAKTLPDGVTGVAALEAFASAIESTNSMQWPKSDLPS